ncbi:hypothetical protein GCM10009745_71930 [Kribbella yunnanensis]|uniref:Uncharacterized protein n=1 Tax=Kribbella yunnanensis TaxID=190194 RepID=A0ABP4V0F4_9ACTN
MSIKKALIAPATVALLLAGLTTGPQVTTSGLSETQTPSTVTTDLVVADGPVVPSGDTPWT